MKIYKHLFAALLSLLFFFIGVLRAETTEVVVFKSKPGVSDQQILSAADGMRTTLSGWSGFVSRDLLKVGNGQWIDIIHWDNMASAQAAQDKAMKCEKCLSFFSLIADEGQQSFHGEKVFSAARQ